MRIGVPVYRAIFIGVKGVEETPQVLTGERGSARRLSFILPPTPDPGYPCADKLRGAMYKEMCAAQISVWKLTSFVNRHYMDRGPRFTYTAIRYVSIHRMVSYYMEGQYLN